MKKTLKITYLKKAEKFLLKNSTTISEAEVDDLIILAVKKKLFHIDVNIDLKALKGSFRGKFRIRKGKIRIIFEIIENEIMIESIVEDVNFRGNIY